MFHKFSSVSGCGIYIAGIFFSCAPTLTLPTPLITCHVPWQRGSVSQGWSTLLEHLCFFPVAPEESGVSGLPVRAGTLTRSLSCDIAHVAREEHKVNLKWKTNTSLPFTHWVGLSCAEIDLIYQVMSYWSNRVGRVSRYLHLCCFSGISFPCYISFFLLLYFSVIKAAGLQTEENFFQRFSK